MTEREESDDRSDIEKLWHDLQNSSVRPEDDPFAPPFESYEAAMERVKEVQKILGINNRSDLVEYARRQMSILKGKPMPRI